MLRLAANRPKCPCNVITMDTAFVIGACFARKHIKALAALELRAGFCVSEFLHAR